MSHQKLVHKSVKKDVFKDYTATMDYQGYYNNNGEVLLFYKVNGNLVEGPVLATSTEIVFYATIDS